MDPRRYAQISLPFCALSLLSLSACDLGEAQGTGGSTAARKFIPNYSAAAPAHRTDQPCADADPSHLCLALQYVSYQDSTGRPIVTDAAARSNVTEINSVWSQCHVQFILETYRSIDPRSYGLAFQPTTMAELGTIRTRLASGNTLLVTTTGQWTGDLGAQTANAWSILPPVGPFGATLEAGVAYYPNLIAHELGHYLNLEHAGDSYNVMNPTVYSSSINITDAQCIEARATAISFWSPMLR